LADVHREHLAQKRNAGKDVQIHGGGQGADSACLAACLLGNLTSPSHAAAKQEAFMQLEEALNQMDPLDREVLALRHFEELSNTETASLLGIQPAAASKRYVRALARLKEILESLPGFNPNG
jgi:RNA polymerase sigma-70 factor (ECF subfamily)